MAIISVIMCTHNTPKSYLEEAIESILKQTFWDFEFIIVNDGSTAADSEVVKSFEDNRIILIENKDNMGLPYSLNRAIKLSKGKYIARMDSDDISLPQRFEKQYQYMEQHKDIAVLGCVAKTFGRTSRLIISPIYSDLNDQLYFRSSIVHPSVMFRKEFLEKTIYYIMKISYVVKTLRCGRV